MFFLLLVLSSPFRIHNHIYYLCLKIHCMQLNNVCKNNLDDTVQRTQLSQSLILYWDMSTFKIYNNDVNSEYFCMLNLFSEFHYKTGNFWSACHCLIRSNFNMVKEKILFNILSTNDEYYLQYSTHNTFYNRLFSKDLQKRLLINNAWCLYFYLSIEF